MRLPTERAFRKILATSATAILLSACGSGAAPSPTETPRSTDTPFPPTPTTIPTEAPTATATLIATNTATRTSVPTETSTPTLLPPTRTPESTPTIVVATLAPTRAPLPTELPRLVQEFQPVKDSLLAGKWDIKNGTIEFQDRNIKLVSDPRQTAVAYSQTKREITDDFEVSVGMETNGSDFILVGSNSDGEVSLVFRLSGKGKNNFTVRQEGTKDGQSRDIAQGTALIGDIRIRFTGVNGDPASRIVTVYTGDLKEQIARFRPPDSNSFRSQPGPGNTHTWRTGLRAGYSSETVFTDLELLTKTRNP